MRLRNIFLLPAGLLLTVVGARSAQESGAPTQSASSSEQAHAALLLNFDPMRTIIHWTLPATLHTVHGTFRLKRGSLRLDPATGKASGEIVVDAASGESGNNDRDSKMQREVLESSKYSDIIFHPDRFSGTIPASGEVKAELHGIFSLHGADHEMTIPVAAELSGSHWSGNSTFTVPYVKWGLRNPSNFFLKVKPEVQIQFEAVGSLEPGS